MGQDTLEPEFELTEPLDEIELAKYRRMAVDARTGHFPTHIYGDQDHIEVLAKALERCVDAIEDDNAETVVDKAKDKIDELDEHIDLLEGELDNIFKSAEKAIGYIQIRQGK